MLPSIHYLGDICPFKGFHIQLYCVQMKSLLSLLLIVVIGVSPVLVFGQTATPPPPPMEPQDQDDVIRVRSNEVRLDIVVKDKKGRPIKDLKASDFEVMEDGVAQKVESFRFVSREAAPVTAENKSNPAAPPKTPVTQP